MCRSRGSTFRRPLRALLSDSVLVTGLRVVARMRCRGVWLVVSASTSFGGLWLSAGYVSVAWALCCLLARWWQALGTFGRVWALARCVAGPVHLVCGAVEGRRARLLSCGSALIELFDVWQSPG